MHDSTIGCIWNLWSVFIVHYSCNAETTDFKSPPLIYKDLNVYKGFKLCEIILDFYPVLWLTDVSFPACLTNQKLFLVLYNC